MTTTFYDHWRDVPEGAWRWKDSSPAEIACRGTGNGLIARPWARTALQWGAVGLAVVLFLFSFRPAPPRR